MTQNQQTYDRLNISLSMDDVMGESSYNSMLPDLVNDLLERGIAVKDQGACVVFLEEFANKNGDPMGVIIQKSDGGFLYTTTDIACAKYRYANLNADRLIYYIDARQSQHLQQAWTIVRKAGYVPESVPIEHHAFGMMLGKDGKPFKTRVGGVVKLSKLLDEAEDRAARMMAARDHLLSEEQRVSVIRTIAIGSVKYADLSKNRLSDYIFDWDHMLSFEGNTAPYLLYAYTRVRSIFRKSGTNESDLNSTIVLDTDKERLLAVKLVQFTEAVQAVARDGTPHILCGYLYDLAGLFMSFYEHCPVNKENLDADLKNGRLLLCSLTAKTLKQGLSLLGIDTVEQM